MNSKQFIWRSLQKAYSAWFISKTSLLYRHFFKSIGYRSVIYRPFLIANPHCISIGERVTIRNGARLEVVLDGVNSNPLLEIGSHTNIEQNVHFACHSSIKIGAYVSITANCAIVDVIHPYADVEDARSISARIDTAPSFVEIGDYCFIGLGAIILPNVKLGRHCVVGAHAVVTKSFPDFSVITGAPATSVKIYSEEACRWIDTKRRNAG